MTRTELLELIANGENSGVEFERDTVENRGLAKELVAFANFEGGRVLLGVEDDGQISGISRDSLEEWVMTACRDKIRPEVIPYFEIIRNADGDKSVAVVTVQRGYSVHCLWHEQRRTYYIRAGSTSREAGIEELQRLSQQRGGIRWEVQPISGSTMRDLDLRRLTEYFSEIRSQNCPDVTDEAGWQRLLSNTELVASEEPGSPASAAGMLLFGRNPNRFLPQAGIDATAYPGVEKDFNWIERLSIRGPMVRLGQGLNATESGSWEAARAFFERHLSREEMDQEDRRVRRWDIPSDVLREGVVNALVHRDYLLSATTIEVSIFLDRVEIVSPGRLPNGINPDRMRVGCRAARNQLVKDTLIDYGYMEHMGLGIPRKIVPGMLEHNGTAPDLIADPEMEEFKLRLWRSRPHG